MNEILLSLFFGFVLGLKHAVEADHLIAVTTLVTKHKNPLNALVVGVVWGAGHTAALLIVGFALFLFNITITDRLSLFFEAVVGGMLVVLGVRALFFKNTLHKHVHSHNGETHSHLHSKHHHGSFFVGMVHGVAGSGALMLLVLATIESVYFGILYIVLFGVGSIVGMAIMSLIVGLPAYFSAYRFARVEKWVRVGVGSLSIGFGLYMIYEFLFV